MQFVRTSVVEELAACDALHHGAILQKHVTFVITYRHGTRSFGGRFNYSHPHRDGKRDQGLRSITYLLKIGNAQNTSASSQLQSRINIKDYE